MNRFYCDVCNLQIQVDEQVGGINRIKTVYPQVSKNNFQQQNVQEVWDLCEKCQRVIWEIVEKKKAELLTKK